MPDEPSPQQPTDAERMELPGDAGERARSIVVAWRQRENIAEHRADWRSLYAEIAAALQSERAAAASQARRETWQPIETYPREWEPGAETWWGPNALLFVPSGSKAPVSDYRILTGCLEADMWLAWDAAGSMWDLIGQPTHWQPLPEPPRALANPQESA